MARVAFLGLGRMGTPMARRLAHAGHELAVWNRTHRRADPLVADGVTAALDPTEAVRDPELVVTMLSDPAAVWSVVDAVAGALPAGSCLVDTSTVDPDTVHRVRGRLPAGVGLVDAPVLGSVDAAAAGSLTVLAGGGQDVDRAEPLLAAFGRVVRCGPLGQGAAAKLVLATAIFGAVPLVAEALTLADALGVDDALAGQLLAASPVGGVVDRIHHTGADFAIDLAAKDLALATAAAPGLTVTAAAGERLRAASRHGYGDLDLGHVLDHMTGGAPPDRPDPREDAHAHHHR